MCEHNSMLFYRVCTVLYPISRDYIADIAISPCVVLVAILSDGSQRAADACCCRTYHQTIHSSKHVWYCMVLYGIEWYCMVLYGMYCMVLYGIGGNISALFTYLG